ncbi:MAG: hypothetical protein JEZ11_15960 [Desulfobacterales bacterium]|nr:hypothetical protein [Desulfobacterales bacterium]
MFVDDEVDFLSAIQRALRKEPYPVVTALSGPAAFEKIKTDLAPDGPEGGRNRFKGVSQKKKRRSLQEIGLCR